MNSEIIYRKYTLIIIAIMFLYEVNICCDLDFLDSLCCPTVTLTGLSNTTILGTYTVNGSMIHGRPLYVDERKTYGIWFDGGTHGGFASDWHIGPLQALWAKMLSTCNIP